VPLRPLTWSVQAELARDNVPIDRSGPAFPVIVFSHGSTNDPIDYAYTLEELAAKGFVVAAPYHVNNTQDDVRIDYINGINKQLGLPLMQCQDHRPPPCSRTEVAFSMADRVHDISQVLDSLPDWLGDRADVSRAGVLGHSRGTVTALAAAGGSVDSSGVNCQNSTNGDPRCWPLSADSRVKAIMGLAIGAANITSRVDLANVRVPTMLVAGEQDVNSFPAISEATFQQISSQDKALIMIKNAVHRSFDSTYCAELQAAGAIAQADSQAVLDAHTAKGIVTSPMSGKATEYCPLATFTTPTDIRPLVATMSGQPFPNNVPTTGVDTDEVKQAVTELASTFFGTVLKRVGNDGPHFTRYLAPKWLENHVPIVDTAEVFSSSEAICPPGQQVVCSD
jgi:predicted dienelactone hydrolase